MDITKTAKELADSVTSAEKARGATVTTLAKIINEAMLGDEVIENFIKQFADVVSPLVKVGTLKVYKTQIRKIMKLAISHKKEVLAHAKTSGNLDSWYKHCLDKAPKKNGKQTPEAPKTAEADKVGAEDKAPSEVVKPIEVFKASAKTMLEAGMTIHQLHDLIDSLAVKEEEKKAA